MIEKLVGLVGKARVGKDTFAEYLIQHNYKRYAFADPIKELARKSPFNWNGIKDQRGRKLLQDLGQTGRNYDHNCWINFTEEKIKLNGDKYIIFSDVRHLNEAEWITSNGGILCKILRPSNKETLQGELALHLSETEVDLIQTQHIIENNQDLTYYQYQIESFCNLFNLLEST